MCTQYSLYDMKNQRVRNGGYFSGYNMLAKEIAGEKMKMHSDNVGTNSTIQNKLGKWIIDLV